MLFVSTCDQFNQQFHHVISLWKSSCPFFALYGARFKTV